MRRRLLPLASVLAISSLAFGPAAYAACSNAMTLPACIDTITFEDTRGFDLYNGCETYAVSVNMAAASVDLTFNLGAGEKMSEEIGSEMPEDELQILTDAFEDGSLSLMCCPDFSRFTQCRPKDSE